MHRENTSSSMTPSKPPCTKPGWPQRRGPMWKTEVALLVPGPAPPALSVEEGLEGLEIHMYGAIVTFPDPERLPATKLDWRRDGLMVRWGRDSL